jgi:cytochrome P450
MSASEKAPSQDSFLQWLNPFDPAFRDNPYPTYHRLRERDPIHPLPALNLWFLTRYADVQTVLRDTRFSSESSADDPNLFRNLRESGGELGPLARTMLHWMPLRDPPHHTRLRHLVNKAFTPRQIEAMRPRIASIVDRLLEPMLEVGRMDFVRDFAHPLPVIVIAEMLGVPVADQAELKQWSDDMALALDPLQVGARRAEGDRAALAMRGLFERVAEERRRAPRDDLLSALLAAEEQGDRLSMDELLATCVLLLFAGNETTTNLLGNGLLALLRNPDQLALLQEDPSLVRAAVEELLRYDSPLQFAARLVKQDVEIDGRTLVAGQRAVLLLGSANHDPAEFSDPDRLDIRRHDQRHVAFGFGMHFCLGAGLARAEAQIALDTLARRLPGLRLAADPPVRRPSIALRGLSSLPVEFEVRRSH